MGAFVRAGGILATTALKFSPTSKIAMDALIGDRCPHTGYGWQRLQDRHTGRS